MRAILVLSSAVLLAQTDANIARFEKLAAADPANAQYQDKLAKAYIQKMRETTDFGYLDRASRILENVLAARPGDYEALRLRSEIELERHHFAAVREYSEEMTKFAPDDPWNWGTLGDSLMELGEYDAAGKAYNRMVALRPDLSSYNRLSYHQWVTGDANGAIAIMRNAIASGSAAPENVAWCLVDLGNMLYKLGKLSEAEETYSSALRTFPRYYKAYAGLGQIRLAQGKYSEAIENYKRAQASVPFPEYAAALEKCYEKLGNTEEARRQRGLIDIVDKMARAGNEKANRNLAIIYADQNRNLARALELMREELKVRRDVYTYDALAWVLYRNGQYAEAEKASQEALKLGTPEPDFKLHAAKIAEAHPKPSPDAPDPR